MTATSTKKNPTIINRYGNTVRSTAPEPDPTLETAPMPSAARYRCAQCGATGASSGAVVHYPQCIAHGRWYVDLEWKAPVEPPSADSSGKEPLPAYAKGSDTSKAAAESMRANAPVLRERVFEFVKLCGGGGTTCDNAEAYLGLTHQTCSARFNELARSGRIFDSGHRQKTRSGRAAAVYVVKEAP